jgi:hypothetical protein
MPQELLAALVGAAFSGLLMVLANRSSRRQGDIRELFHRMNSVEQSIARLEVTKRDPNGWRKR